VPDQRGVSGLVPPGPVELALETAPSVHGHGRRDCAWRKPDRLALRLLACDPLSLRRCGPDAGQLVVPDGEGAAKMPITASITKARTTPEGRLKAAGGCQPRAIRSMDGPSTSPKMGPAAMGSATGRDSDSDAVARMMKMPTTQQRRTRSCTASASWPLVSIREFEHQTARDTTRGQRQPMGLR